MAGWFQQNLPTGIGSGGQTLFRPTGTTSTVGSGNRLVPLEQGGIVGDPRLHDGIPGNAGTPMGGGGQDPRAFLQSLAAGGKLTPQQLTAAIPQLQQMGVRVLGANSEGIQSKIQLPNGQVVDLIRDAGGDNGFQWLTGSGGGGGGGAFGGGSAAGLPPGYWTGQETGGGQYPLAAAGGPGLATPWTTPFKSPGDFQSPGDFKAPNVTDDPGFKFRMEEAQKGLERSAASRGTLLTGGTLRDTASLLSNLGSQEYANAYGRALGENNLAYGRAWDENNLAYNRGLGEYNLARGIYGENNQNLYNRLSNLAGLGQQVDTSGFANSMGNTITGAGDARAQGTLNSAGAWQGALGTLGNFGQSIPSWNAYMQGQQQQQPFVPGWSTVPEPYPSGGYYGVPVGFPGRQW